MQDKTKYLKINHNIIITNKNTFATHIKHHHYGHDRHECCIQNTHRAQRQHLARGHEHERLRQLLLHRHQILGADVQRTGAGTGQIGSVHLVAGGALALGVRIHALSIGWHAGDVLVLDVAGADTTHEHKDALAVTQQLQCRTRYVLKRSQIYRTRMVWRSTFTTEICNLTRFRRI